MLCTKSNSCGWYQQHQETTRANQTQVANATTRAKQFWHPQILNYCTMNQVKEIWQRKPEMPHLLTYSSNALYTAIIASESLLCPEDGGRFRCALWTPHGTRSCHDCQQMCRQTSEGTCLWCEISEGGWNWYDVQWTIVSLLIKKTSGFWAWSSCCLSAQYALLS